ncbi:MAG: hypothetical protein ACREA0_31705, partial [bacterium]
ENRAALSRAVHTYLHGASLVEHVAERVARRDSYSAYRKALQLATLAVSGEGERDAARRVLLEAQDLNRRGDRNALIEWVSERVLGELDPPKRSSVTGRRESA